MTRPTNAALARELTEVRDQVADLHRDLGQLREDLASARRDLSAATASIKQLVDAWNAAGTLVTFVKWAASIVTAFAIVWWAVTNPDFWKHPH